MNTYPKKQISYQDKKDLRNLFFQSFTGVGKLKNTKKEYVTKFFQWIDEIDPNILSAESIALSIKYKMGSPLHEIAKDHADLIPQKYLTEELLAIKDDDGNTLAHVHNPLDVYATQEAWKFYTTPTPYNPR
jgi:hypothetical protein